MGSEQHARPGSRPLSSPRVLVLVLPADNRTVRAGPSLAQRAAAAEVRPAAPTAGLAQKAYVRVSSAWDVSGAESWNRLQLLETLNAFMPVREAARMAVHPPQAIDHPFAPEDDGFAATADLRDWAIDDVAWLVELAAYACHENGIEQDVLISVREARA